MSDIVLTPLRRIPTYGGEVRRALKASDDGFPGFGEAYFTSVEPGLVKGWRLHHRMVSNLIVCAGVVRFVLVNEETGERRAFRLGPDEPVGYGRLTVPPGWWLAFGGAGPGLNLMLNLASIEHDPAEADTRPMDAFDWTWDET